LAPFTQTRRRYMASWQAIYQLKIELEKLAGFMEKAVSEKPKRFYLRLRIFLS